MQVQNINSNNYKNHYSPNFGKIIVTENAQKYLNFLWDDRPKYIKDLKTWKRQLRKTKSFNLMIDGTHDSISMKVIDKNSNLKNCRAPLKVVLDRDNELVLAGKDIAYSKDNKKSVEFYLHFPSEEEATIAKNDIEKYQYRNLDTHEWIEWAVTSVKILEQGLKMRG